MKHRSDTGLVPSRPRLRLLVLFVSFGLLAVFVWRYGLAGPAGNEAEAGDGNAGQSTETNAGTVPEELRARELEPLAVTAIVAKRAPFVLSVYGTGRAEATRRADLSASVGGRVDRVRVIPGADVSRGELLVALDPVPYEITLREADAQRVRADVDYERQLFQDETADEEKRTRVAHLTGRTEAELRVERAQRDLDATKLRAPFSGVVSRVSVQTGERIGAEQAVVSLVSLDRIRIPVEVLESDVPPLRVGGSANVRFAALPGESFVGEIEALGPEIDPETGTGRAYVELDNPDHRIRPGMYAEVLLEAGSYPDRISVPREALLERDRKLLVFRAKAGRAEWTYVETGLETDDRVELLSGVAPGDSVLVEGHLTLAHGAPIKAKTRPDLP
ncbi:MAG: efflux RND transporter periplasmic adaptor subunit [Candidatus Eisenbacteria bacterium]|uniref:Efflux RND transporter periplasmic adaptor subunit n=1 Tax=Eiseniibacteriota bacterium TaxID=2212470 RepID=A0A956SBU1_UNCEI|nr:efflux RND transporter periplasmic adaptor subunit [Candidatus Eisenbacteria bacterium]MCB9464948.1 efflux RND transporter periplasmic adaptor subunit [Candidatus Eisenbacteria bacterium]